jgi:hypothetical protein
MSLGNCAKPCCPQSAKPLPDDIPCKTRSARCLSSCRSLASAPTKGAHLGRTTSPPTGTIGVGLNPSPAPGRDPEPSSLWGYGSSAEGFECNEVTVASAVGVSDGTEDTDPPIGASACVAGCRGGVQGKLSRTKLGCRGRVYSGMTTLSTRMGRSGGERRNSMQGVAPATICCNGGGGAIELVPCVGAAAFDTGGPTHW